MTASLLLGLSLTIAAQAAPPEFVTAPGLETVCAAVEEIDPDEDSIATSATYLRDQADLDMDAVSAALGNARIDEDPRVAVAGDTVVFAARTGPKIGYVDFDMILVNSPAKLTVGDSSTELDGGTMVHASHYADADIMFTELTIYDADGKATQTLSHKASAADATSADSMVLIDGKNGVDRVAVVFMYGDIIIGGMDLENFND